MTTTETITLPTATVTMYSITILKTMTAFNHGFIKDHEQYDTVRHTIVNECLRTAKLTANVWLRDKDYKLGKITKTTRTQLI